VAHTANDSVDLIDTKTGRYLMSIPGLNRVAGVLVSEERNLVFTSNRAEDTVSIFEENKHTDVVKVKVGIDTNGLAFAPGHRRAPRGARSGGTDWDESETRPWLRRALRRA
jgi:DNA-binding beta-propeller fold protein YncE